MIDAYDFIKAWANPGEFAGWWDMSVKPPNNIHVLINIKNWGSAIGRLATDNRVFIISLPHEDSPTFLQIPVSHVTHWAVIPTIKDDPND